MTDPAAGEHVCGRTFRRKWRIYSLRGDGYRHEEARFDKTQARIKSTITFLLQDVRTN